MRAVSLVLVFLLSLSLLLGPTVPRASWSAMLTSPILSSLAGEMALGWQDFCWPNNPFTETDWGDPDDLALAFGAEGQAPSEIDPMFYKAYRSIFKYSVRPIFAYIVNREVPCDVLWSLGTATLWRAYRGWYLYLTVDHVAFPEQYDTEVLETAHLTINGGEVIPIWTNGEVAVVAGKSNTGLSSLLPTQGTVGAGEYALGERIYIFGYTAFATEFDSKTGATTEIGIFAMPQIGMIASPYHVEGRGGGDFGFQANVYSGNSGGSAWILRDNGVPPENSWDLSLLGVVNAATPSGYGLAHHVPANLFEVIKQRLDLLMDPELPDVSEVPPVFPTLAPKAPAEPQTPSVEPEPTVAPLEPAGAQTPSSKVYDEAADPEALALDVAGRLNSARFGAGLEMLSWDASLFLTAREAALAWGEHLACLKVKDYDGCAPEPSLEPDLPAGFTAGAMDRLSGRNLTAEYAATIWIYEDSLAREHLLDERWSEYGVAVVQSAGAWIYVVLYGEAENHPEGG